MITGRSTAALCARLLQEEIILVRGRGAPWHPHCEGRLARPSCSHHRRDRLCRRAACFGADAIDVRVGGPTLLFFMRSTTLSLGVLTASLNSARPIGARCLRCAPLNLCVASPSASLPSPRSALVRSADLPRAAIHNGRPLRILSESLRGGGVSERQPAAAGPQASP